MTKQCKALELCEGYESLAHDRGVPRFASAFVEVGFAIKNLIRQHEAEFAKAQGEWIKTGSAPLECGVPVIGHSPDWIDEDFNAKGTRECFLSGDDETWISAKWNGEQDCYDVCEATPAMWQHYPEPPAPPPLPEPEIEVPDLVLSSRAYSGATVNEAHKAAMRPLLKRIRDLEEGRA